MKKMLMFLIIGFFVITNINALGCNHDGICGWPETCNTCSDCHSCDIRSYTGQRAKYIDQDCQFNGDGLSDSCASSDGGNGRFNELQSAINSLVAGDTLYIYPGDYYRPRQAGHSGIYDIFEQSSGTTDNPTIITSRFRDNPPVLHSTDPDGGSTESRPAITTHWDHDVGYVIIDGIKVRGLAQITGNNNKLQNIQCTYGGGACDGNWACLRIEWCTNCIAHHNFVHDVDDAGFCGMEPTLVRPCGLKEFSSTRSIWEFNTVRNSLQWGYDLHRNSVNTTIRYNLFENPGYGNGIRIHRSRNNYIYGNLIIMDGGGACIKVRMLNEQSSGEHSNLIDHNTCIYPGLGINTCEDITSQITNNLFYGVGTQRIEQGNTAASGENNINHNAYDSNGYYHNGLYLSLDYSTLESWQTATGYDLNSYESAVSYCQLADAPTSASDFDYNASVTGNCLTASSTGGQVGVYGITDCVGHTCGNISVDDPDPKYNNCSQGQITSECTCGDKNYSVGYCCNGIWFDPYYSEVIGGCPSGDFYYVDQNHAAASDSNPGTASEPWETIQQGVAQVTAGDTLIVKEGIYAAEGTGQRYNPALNPANSGTAENPIIIKGYGNVELRHSSNNGPIVGTLNRNNIVWDGFYMNENYVIPHADTGPLVVWASENVTIMNMKIIGQPISYEDNHDGVRVEACNDVVVRNCEISGFTNNHGSGVKIYDSTNLLIENNEIYNCSSGIFPKGGGIRLITAVIRYNFLYDNTKGLHFIFTEWADVYQNIIKDCINGIEFHIYEEGVPRNLDIVNNILDNSGERSLYLAPGEPYSGVTAGHRIYNNIIINSNSRAISPVDSTMNDKTDWDFDYNNYYSYSEFTEDHNTLSDWQSGMSQDLYSFTSDPQFVDSVNSDYRLNPGSPCINRGVDILDLNNDGSTTDSINIGAYITGDECIGLLSDCGGSVSELTCSHPAEMGTPDCVIDINELNSYLNNWKSSPSISLFEVIDAIGKWKTGGYS